MLAAVQNLTVTFEAQTFIFASNISCQLHLGKSNFLSSLLPFLAPLPFLQFHLCFPNFPHSLHYSHHTCSTFLFTLRSRSQLSPFLPLIPPMLPFTISPVSSSSAWPECCQHADTLSFPLWSQNQPNQLLAPCPPARH